MGACIEKGYISLNKGVYMGKAKFIAVGTVIIFAAVLIFAYKYQTLPDPTREAAGDIDVSAEPIQVEYSGRNFYKTYDSVEFTIEPVVSFSGSFLVISTRYHYRSPTDKLSPVDLCVMWGELVNPEHREHVQFSIQAARWCSVSWDTSIGLDEEYVHSHIANIHVIPANENVLKALKSVKTEQSIHVEGYLVNVYHHEKCIWRTSLSWTDSDCEFLYLTKIVIGNWVYE